MRLSDRSVHELEKQVSNVCLRQLRIVRREVDEDYEISTQVLGYLPCTKTAQTTLAVCRFEIEISLVWYVKALVFFTDVATSAGRS